ncbi:hypothetical protein PFNF54_02687, partial [Plasmodium falciparum NF54]
MKLHCSKILLFLLPLNILVTSLSNVHNNNKLYNTPHHIPTTTSRMLSECDLYIPKYDNDADMKSVKENFDRQTSQRFEEYDERMKGKRQKRKEQRDKNIQEIIEKDRMDKLLAEKVEKGCLRCGCGLGGVAASVGLFGGLGIYVSKSAALATAIAEGAETAKAAGEAARIPAAIDAVIKGITKVFGVSTLDGKELGTYITATNYTNFKTIALAINEQYNPLSCIIPDPGADKSICPWVMRNFFAAKDSPRNVVSAYNSIEVAVKSIVLEAQSVTERAAKKATEDVIKSSIAAVDAKYVICQNAIIASVVALLII